MESYVANEPNDNGAVPEDVGSGVRPIAPEDDIIECAEPITSLELLLNSARKEPKAKHVNGASRSWSGTRPPTNIIARAKAWMAKADISIAGKHGHNPAIRVIQRVVRGFDLNDDEAIEALEEWNQRCQPPWSKTELLHKIRDGRKTGATPIGELRDAPIEHDSGPCSISGDDPLSSIHLQDDRGAPAKTAGNVAILLATHPVWRGGPSFDAYSQTEIWPYPIPTPLASIHRAEREIVDADHAAVQEWILSLPVSYRVRAGLDVVSVGVHLASARRRIDLLCEWIEALPIWDKKTRLDTWPSVYLGCDNNAYIRATGRAWLIAAIERALTPGILIDAAPVLEGPQRSGKNRALETLFAGGPSWAPWLCGVRGDAMDNDNAKRIACGRWILQDDEMRAREPKYLDAIKAWHSRTQETYRLPYAREITVAKRRGLLIASTDKHHYLHDDTGNRRWWPWKTGRIAIEKLARDRLQLLSEALVAVKAGARWRDGVTDAVYSEALRVADERRLVDPLLEQIHTLVETGSFRGVLRPNVLTTQTIGSALGYGIEKIDRAFETRVGAAMHELGFIAQRQTIDNGTRVRVYVLAAVGQVDRTLDDERSAIVDE